LAGEECAPFDMPTLIEGVVQFEVSTKASANILTEGTEDWLPEFIFF